MESKMASEKLKLFNLFVERMKAKNLYTVVEKFIGEYIKKLWVICCICLIKY